MRAARTDSDGDGVSDCEDGCPADPDKTAPGRCGCGISDEECPSECRGAFGFSLASNVCFGSASFDEVISQVSQPHPPWHGSAAHPCSHPVLHELDCPHTACSGFACGPLHVSHTPRALLTQAALVVVLVRCWYSMDLPAPRSASCMRHCRRTWKVYSQCVAEVHPLI